jgi:hypothetical protein
MVCNLWVTDVVLSWRNSILNKLTEDQFEPLSQQMVDLLKSKATDVEILREIINIIFDKALAEPGFSTMYAELCRVLEKNCPTFETNKEGKPQVPPGPPFYRCSRSLAADTTANRLTLFLVSSDFQANFAQPLSGGFRAQAA